MISVLLVVVGLSVGGIILLSDFAKGDPEFAGPDNFVFVITLGWYPTNPNFQFSPLFTPASLFISS